MKTRRVFVSGLFDIEQRTDGWYYQRLQSKEGWNGPYRDIGDVVDAMSREIEIELRWLYQLLFKEAPR